MLKAIFSDQIRIEIIRRRILGYSQLIATLVFIAIAKRLKEKGAEVVHLGNCIVSSCPCKDVFINGIRDEVGIKLVCKTH
jgi:predicted metal-binding protein